MTITNNSKNIAAIFITASVTLMGQTAFAQDDEMTPPSLIQQNTGNVSAAATIGQTVEDAHTLGKLEKVIDLSGLNTNFGDDKYTIFAPRDSSFWQVTNVNYGQLMTNPAYADSVLKSHIVPGRIVAKNIIAEVAASADGRATRKTIGGQKLTFTLSGEFLQVTDAHGSTAEVTRADIQKDDGVIHIINTVLNTETPMSQVNS